MDPTRGVAPSVDLDEKENKEFMHSIDAVKALWEAASKIDPDLSK
jgi:malate dehydrogenase